MSIGNELIGEQNHRLHVENNELRVRINRLEEKLKATEEVIEVMQAELSSSEMSRKLLDALAKYEGRK